MALFTVDEHVEVEATEGIYQRTIDRRLPRTQPVCGRELLQAVIDSVSRGVPAALTEVITLGRTLRKRARRARVFRPARHLWWTSAAPPSASATSPTTSPGPCSRPEASDHPCALECEERLTPAVVDQISATLANSS